MGALNCPYPLAGQVLDNLLETVSPSASANPPSQPSEYSPQGDSERESESQASQKEPLPETDAALQEYFTRWIERSL
jgi:hypothetical protein